MSERAAADPVGETRRLLEFLRTPVALLLLDVEAALEALDRGRSSENLEAANASLHAAHSAIDYLKRVVVERAGGGDRESMRAASKTTRRARVLLVANDAETCDQVSRVLYDCEVVRLHDSLAVQGSAPESPFDVILWDATGDQSQAIDRVGALPRRETSRIVLLAPQVVTARTRAFLRWMRPHASGAPVAKMDSLRSAVAAVLMRAQQERDPG